VSLHTKSELGRKKLMRAVPHVFGFCYCIVQLSCTYFFIDLNRALPYDFDLMGLQPNGYSELKCAKERSWTSTEESQHVL